MKNLMKSVSCGNPAKFVWQEVSPNECWKYESFKDNLLPVSNKINHNKDKQEEKSFYELHPIFKEYNLPVPMEDDEGLLCYLTDFVENIIKKDASDENLYEKIGEEIKNLSPLLENGKIRVIAEEDPSIQQRACLSKYEDQLRSHKE